MKKMSKVVKFGGSSLASAQQFAKVGKIITADKERRFVVPSAPGKRNSKDTKVTDMLYGCYDLAEKDEDFRVALMKIKDRYDTIINGLNLKLSLEEEFTKISENFKKKAGTDYAASRGEYLNSIIMANYLGFEFVDAAEVIFFDNNGNFDAIKTDETLSARLTNVECAVDLDSMAQKRMEP
jgi:aspartate kinase